MGVQLAAVREDGNFSLVMIVLKRHFVVAVYLVAMQTLQERGGERDE
jgi:hypothetical protein